MAKESLKESIIKTHKLDIEGTVNLEEKCIETVDNGNIKLDDLFIKFNGEFVKLSIVQKEEEVL